MAFSHLRSALPSLRWHYPVQVGRVCAVRRTLSSRSPRQCESRRTVRVCQSIVAAPRVSSRCGSKARVRTLGCDGSWFADATHEVGQADGSAEVHVVRDMAGHDAGRQHLR